MATARLDLGAQFREELTCSICLELFTRPKVLPCQHTFCQDCLQDHAGSKLRFRCPNCRRQFRVPRQGIERFPDSHLVTNLCETLQEQATLSEETTEQSYDQSDNRCSVHPSEKLKLYCKQCELPLCVDCVEESHEGHPTMSLKKAIQERQATLETLIDEGRNILEKYCSFLRGLREQEKSLEEQKQRADESIIEAYGQMVQKLIQSKSDLLAEVQKQHIKNVKLVKGLRDAVLADVDELSAACDRAEQEVVQGATEVFGQGTVLTEVVEKYREKAAPLPVQTWAQIAVFQPTENPVPILGHVTVQSLPYTPPPDAPTATATKNKPTVIIFGGEGQELGKFREPTGVAVSEDGEIFVADKGNERIQVFTLQGTFVRHFPTMVSMDITGTMRPHTVAMDGNGSLWVVGNKFSPDTVSGGWFGFAVHCTKQGRVLRNFGLGEGRCNRGVAVDSRRNLIFVNDLRAGYDRLYGRVLVYQPDGTLVGNIGSYGNSSMGHIWHMTVDREGRILVPDCEYHIVYVYDERGNTLVEFGGCGRDEGQLDYPTGICTDRAGNIIVVDNGNRRVELFDKEGEFLKHIAIDMEEPRAVAMAPQGQLVLTDLKNHTVTVFDNIWDCLDSCPVAFKLPDEVRTSSSSTTSSHADPSPLRRFLRSLNSAFK